MSTLYRGVARELFEQALVLLVLFFVANIFCRAVVYPLASRACAGRAPAVEPEADGEGGE